MNLPAPNSDDNQALFDRPWAVPAILLFVFVPVFALIAWKLCLFRQQVEDEKARAAALIQQEIQVTAKNGHPSLVSTSALETFLERVKYSHQLAIIKYPELGIEDSDFRKRFLRHLQLWNDSHDPRLDQPNWPKLLADVSEQDNENGRNGRWTTPRPLYPYHARANHEQGSGYVKITTDDNGQVVTATMIESTSSEELDNNTLFFAKEKWKGPPNATTSLPITYRLE